MTLKWFCLLTYSLTYLLSARLKHWSTPTAVCRRRHLYRCAYKNAPWRQEFLACWPAAVEQFTSRVASARRRDRTVQTASKDVSVCARLRRIATFLVYRRLRSLLTYLLTCLVGWLLAYFSWQSLKTVQVIMALSLFSVVSHISPAVCL